jgi:hypothetical protein
MSQTDQQEHGGATAKPRVRKDWEMFWRIVAGLMLIVIAWVVWVLYQITPRSVVTPLAYEARVKAVGPAQKAGGAEAGAAAPPTTLAAPAVPVEAPGAPALQRAAEAAAAGAHQASADAQAATSDKVQERPTGQEQLTRDGLKLSTEITTPLAAKKAIAGKRESNPGVGRPKAQ